MIYHQSLVRKKRRALTFSVETSGPSPYIRGSEVKLDFMEWILFYFYRRLLDGVHPRQSKTRFQQFHPKKPSAAERRRGEEGELPELVSPWASLFYGAHHGHWWKSREKIQEGKRKFQFPNFTQKHKSSLTAEVILVLVSSFIFKIKQAFVDQVEGLRVSSWGLQDIYAITVTRIMHL